jgi:5-hydroxyisourate hydrolase-like protein (transthyretin family)
MKHYCFLIVVLLFAGCGHSSRPADLPKLFPCTVTVTQDGKPLADAVVKLVTQAEDGAKYNPVAVTGEDGKIALSTYGFPGVPVGKYKVVIVKNIDDDIVYRTDDAGEKVTVSYKTYRTIEKQFSDAKTTPYEMEVTTKSKNIDITCDVGKAVKEKM